MTLNDVIDRLVKDLEPVKPVRPLAVRMSMWAAASAAAITALLAAIDVRRSPEAIVASYRPITDASLVALIALTASWGAMKISVPGEGTPVLHRYLPMGLLGAWAAFSIVGVWMEAAAAGVDALVPDRHVICALIVAGAGALLSLPIGFLVRGAAPLSPRWCGALVGAAAGAVAMIGIEFICLHERPIHVATYHVFPVALFALSGALFGPALLTRRVRG